MRVSRRSTKRFAIYMQERPHPPLEDTTWPRSERSHQAEWWGRTAAHDTPRIASALELQPSQSPPTTAIRVRRNLTASSNNRNKTTTQKQKPRREQPLHLLLKDLMEINRHANDTTELHNSLGKALSLRHAASQQHSHPAAQRSVDGQGFGAPGV